jgi:DNA-binding response OmpR family regulator
VNGERVEGPRQLHEGDEIQIALCVRIQFVGNEATVPIDAEKMATAQKSLTLESRTRQVEINDEMVDPPLSLYQYRLLELLYEKRGGICTREEVVKAVWPDDFEAGVSEQAIDALVRRLRDRLADLEPDHQYIMTVRGHGFRLVQPGEDG